MAAIADVVNNKVVMAIALLMVRTLFKTSWHPVAKPNARWLYGKFDSVTVVKRQGCGMP